MNTIDTKSAKLGDELIDKHIKKMFGGLEMASIDYFKETGHISGSFYVRLRDMIEGATASQSLPKEEDKWISVEDRLPEEKQNVLLGHSYGIGKLRSVTAVYTEGKFWAYSCFTEELDEAEEFTHWQPLPSPPIKPLQP